MTGFDETVPPDDTPPSADGTAATQARDNDLDEQGPEHDSRTPVTGDAPDPGPPDS